MANTKEKLDSGVIKWSVDTTGDIELKDAHRTVSRWVIQVDGGGSKTIVTKGILTGSELTAADAEDLHYIARDTGSLVDPGSTAITADGIYDVIADGCDVVLDVTYGSGTVTIYARPVAG